MARPITKKKGSIVLKKDNFLKVAYVHRDAQPSGLGKKVVRMCRQLGIQGLNDLYDRTILIEEETAMTAEQREAYRPYIPEQLWKDDLSWTDTLVRVKDVTKPMIDGVPYMVDYSAFCGAWRNRWRYIIDLDNNTFTVVRGGLEMLSQREDEFFDDADYCAKIAHTRVGQFPLDDIPEDWADQCAQYWKKNVMLLAVDFYQNAEAVFSKEVQDEAKSDHDYERIKFYYGDNGYNELFNTMDKK